MLAARIARLERAVPPAPPPDRVAWAWVDAVIEDPETVRLAQRMQAEIGLGLSSAERDAAAARWLEAAAAKDPAARAAMERLRRRIEAIREAEP